MLQITNILRIQETQKSDLIILSENYKVEGEIPPQFSQRNIYLILCLFKAFEASVA